MCFLIYPCNPLPFFFLWYQSLPVTHQKAWLVHQFSSPINSTASPLFDSQNQTITINVASQIPLKLTSNNYTTWKAQFNSLAIGLNLKDYIDGSTSCPSKTITENNTEIPNPAYLFWIRQDQLIFNAILGSVFEDISPFITLSKSSQAAWKKLATTYAKPSHTQIYHLKENLTHLHMTLSLLLDTCSNQKIMMIL